MIKGIGYALAVAIGALLLGLGGLMLLTRDASMLNSSYLDDAARAAPAAAATPEAVLDAPIDTTVADPSVRLETTREEAAKKAISWLMATVAASALASCLWLYMAHRRSKTVSGVRGQRSMNPAWWLCFATLAIFMAFAGYYVSAVQGFAGDVSAGTLQGSILIIVVAAALTYYFGTAVGVSPTMRPSVPMATVWRR